MDYCSECRRHLNGALVCPGCGAYAPDIAPPGTLRHDGPVAAGPGTTAFSSGFEPAPDPFRPDFEPAPGPFPGEPSTTAGASADVDDAPPVREGRAARRRQQARWKKNQRRAVVATAVALVGGGLTLASMDRHTAGRAQAAALPDDGAMGTATRPEAPGQDPGPSAAPSTSPAHHATPTTRTPGGAAPAVRQTPVTHRRTAPSDPRPDAAAPATPVTAAQPASTPTPASPATGSTSTPAPSAPSTPAPAPATGGSDQATTPSTPARASTSPEQLCVLVLCIG
ncbi:hypothetical protein [Streptomyces sp. NPDC048106]|uniref:SCO2400 family protein n=1 Tax=Streptomyces sp. NPDC048106 TaxID=3155750 RepID=UPI0034530CEC